VKESQTPSRRSLRRRADFWQSVLLGFLHTLGSVLIATLFHGAINPSQGIFLGGMEGASRYWLLSIVYGVAALIAAVALGLNALQSPQLATQHKSRPRTYDSSTTR
jgi:uncharacterized membrane protein YhaH (DUF805 family)